MKNIQNKWIRGAIPALPTLEETLAFVKENY